jgi:ATP-dependent DNA helicase RecQ
LPDPRQRREFGRQTAPKIPASKTPAPMFPSTGTSTTIPLAPQPLHPDEANLREYLREWRRQTAKEREVPAFVILHDTTLEEICRQKPQSIADLLQITGIGERKAEMFGQPVLEALARFRAGARPSALPEKKTAPAVETLALLAQGKTFAEIAQIRSRQISTVVNGVAALVEKGELEFQPDWVDRNRLSVIEAACARIGTEQLKPLKEALPPEITYEEIRLVVARQRREKMQNKVIPA